MAKHWNYASGEHEENTGVDAFIKDIIDVCHKHGMSLSHEDHHGAFIVTDMSDENVNWLSACGFQFDADKVSP